VILSLVTVLGACGVQQMLDPPITADERVALENSAASLREAGRRILAVTPMTAGRGRMVTGPGAIARVETTRQGCASSDHMRQLGFST
jgi:hypothetical protein